LDVFRPELHAYGVRAFLDLARESIGRDGLAALLARYGVTEERLNDPEAWVSLEFVEACFDDLVTATGDPQFVERAARLAISRKYLGPLQTFVSAFGTPSFAYDQIAKSSHRFNKTGDYSMQDRSATACRLTFTPAPSVRERTSYMCRIRAVQLGVVPTLFDLAPAQVEHPHCMLRGDACCEYRLTWSAKRSPRLVAVAFGLVAAGVGVGVASYLGGNQALIVATSGAFAVAGWSIRKWVGLQQVVADRIRDISDHQDALARSMQANEQRFSELLEAKAEVEKKVEQRTKELQETTRQLSETLKKVQELDRTKTDFFNNVSHELRSPLTLILAPLEELLAGRTPASGERNAYESMHRNASRLLRLINQLLDLAKIDAGQMRIHPAVVELPGLVRASLKGFEAAAEKKGVRLTLTAPERMPPMYVDPAWIDSALTNLVANALRLTRSGGGVRVVVEDHGAHATIAVSDDGPGIAPADQQKVFERFAQGDSSKRVVGGTGIGLALVREAAHLHGGEVRLDSTLGVGSTFTISLPRRSAPQVTELASAPPPAPSTSAGASLRPSRTDIIDEVADNPAAANRSGPSLAAPLALVVEDNPELRMFVADALSAHYRVRAASDGVQGLELARRLLPDVIVSDVAMPEMDGYELCRRLRAHQETKNIPVLLVTARTELASVLQGFEAGANDYLLKPFHTTELLARVDVHVRLRRLTAQVVRQERLAALGSLAASVAHNVRNPLSALISGLPAMMNRLGASLDPSTRELIGIMLDCAERIERMTLDLLDLSRIDREVSGEFAPGVGLQACSRMFASRLTPDIDFVTEVDSLAVASGRAGDINHVFMNIIDNALLAVGSKGRIEVRGVADDGYYVVTVADSGHGIDPESIERIFEPFWTTRAAGEGTGLGLSIARQIVEEHNGTITAGRSSLGGALFTVRLPLRKQLAVA
jgi:signal transduction histidine kinase